MISTKLIFLSNRGYESYTVGYADSENINNYSQFAVFGFDENKLEVN